MNEIILSFVAAALTIAVRFLVPNISSKIELRKKQLAESIHDWANKSNRQLFAHTGSARQPIDLDDLKENGLAFLKCSGFKTDLRLFFLGDKLRSQLEWITVIAILFILLFLGPILLEYVGDLQQGLQKLGSFLDLISRMLFLPSIFLFFLTLIVGFILRAIHSLTDTDDN